MTLPLIKPGGWDPEDPLTSDEMDAFQAALVRALDGQDGGTYDLQDDLIFDGSGAVVIQNELRVEDGAVVNLDGTTNLTGDLDVEPGGEINLKTGAPGGRLDVESGASIFIEDGGELRLDDGAELNIPAGDVILEDIGDMTIRDGGELDVIDGGLFIVGDDGQLIVGGDPVDGGRINLVSGGKIVGSSGSEIQVNDMDDLTINADSYVFVVALNPIHVGSQWASEESGTFRCATVATANRLVFPIKVPAGDTITTLRMTIDGGASGGSPHGGGAPTDRPILEFGWVGIDGAYHSLQTFVDPVNTGAYDDPHQVTMSGGIFPYLMTAERHVVRVVGEGITGGQPNATRLCSIDGTALARSMRQTTEIR
jgi:hypothetical protein